MAVLAFLAIYRQIRDFRPRRGDSHLALAIDRQSPKIRDFQPQIGDFGENIENLEILAISKLKSKFLRIFYQKNLTSEKSRNLC